MKFFLSLNGKTSSKATTTTKTNRRMFDGNSITARRYVR